MLNRKLAIVATAGLVAFGGISTNVFAATASTTAAVDIVVPISLTKVTDIDFGVVIADPAASTVVLSPANVAAPTGTTTVQAGTTVVGSFTVGGTNNQAYVIADPGLVNLGSVNLDVDTWTVTNANAQCTNTAVALCTTAALDGSGADTLSFGATLHIPALQVEGQYISAAFNMQVDYQ